jgi:eukaryotic-like serine/threonine-protein kinase
MPETTQFPGIGNDGLSDSTLKANMVLQNRYRILGVLGGGGMGTVYQARDLNFPDVQKLVAIKEMQTLATDATPRGSALKTFQREANILATLSHPAIPKIFDFFDLSNHFYLVMEFINGSDLELLLSKTKELPIDKILEWAIDLCDVLDYLHSHTPEPIIFRDMKPSNVMVDSLGKVRLIDFGIAKTFVSGVKHTMIGTEGYSAPEQYKGDVTPVSDVYSLGATLHHVLTRRDPRLEPPFSFNERSITGLNPKAPPELATIVEKALAFDPPNRYQSCGDMKTALERLRYRGSGMVPAQPGVPGAPAGPNGGLEQTTEGTDFFPGGESRGTIEPRWKFATEDEIRCSPTSLKDLAFIGSYDTNMWAVKVETGEMVWKYPTRGGIASSPVIDDTYKILLFGSEDHTFQALDARTGRKVWDFQTDDRIRSTARVAHDHVFFGSDDGHIFALALANGRKLWSYDLGEPVRSRPFVTNDLVIVGSESGEVVALELSGNRKWHYRTKRGVISSPFVDKDGICYVGSSDNYMYALDTGGGFPAWRFRTNGRIISSPTVYENLLYFGSGDGYLYAVNTQTAKEKWKFQTAKPIVATPIYYRGVIFFGGTDGIFYCLDSETGRERWKFQAGGPITSAAHVAGDSVLVGSMDNKLYALPLAI